MASEKDQVPVAEETTNGEKNGDAKEYATQKLSLGEIAAIDEEIAKAKTEQLQLLHNLFYGKNGNGPQIKRNIRKFAGFEADERQKKLDQLLTYELPALQQTVTILDIKDIKADEEKDAVAKAIVDFLITPTGKTIAEVEKENPVKEDEEEDGEDEEIEEEEEEEEEEVKPKGSPRKRAGDKNKSGRPKRATASRVWTNDYGISDSEEEEVEEVKPKVGRKKKNDSDSESDYNPNVSDDSEADRRKSARMPAAKKPTRGGRKKNISESEEESSSEEEFSEEELPKKKKPVGRGAPPKRGGGAKRGRKRKQETESEEESEEEEEEEENDDSEDSEKAKKSRKPAPKLTPKKNSKGRPKRAAPPAKKKKKDDSDEESDGDEPEESEDDEPLKKPPKKSAAEKSAPAVGGDGAKDGPTDDDIKTLLKDILAEANLEEITMKTVCKKVYAHYPGHDLTQKKDFIKQTVKSLIAA